MNVHISYKRDTSSDIEPLLNQHIDKLRRRIQMFRPDLVRLHVGLHDAGPRGGYNVSLDLRLPSGDIAAQERGTTPEGAVRKAFEDLIEQVGKHKDRLRSQHQWRRARHLRTGSEPSQVPFSETFAAVRPPEKADDGTVREWINSNLHRLGRFVDRELRYREANGILQVEQLSRDEVVDEAIAMALGSEIEKPEQTALEPWLFHLARRALDQLGRPSLEGDNALPIGTPAAARNVNIDEDRLQFHQPDANPTEQDNIADRSVPTPEDIAASDEIVAMIDLALRGAKPEDREAFLLFTVEGFTVDEIAVISGRSDHQVRDSVKAAREHVRSKLPLDSVMKERLLQHSKTA